MMKRTMVVTLTTLMFGAGCIAQQGDGSEQAASTAGPAGSVTASDLPTSSGDVGTPMEGKQSCDDGCDQRADECDFGAGIYAVHRCVTEFDLCMSSCNVRITGPRVYPPLRVEPSSAQTGRLGNHL
jgi:hypothetical protein